MKCKYIFISLLALASCTKEVSVVEELPELPSEAIREAKLNISVLTQLSTKANGFVESFDYEDIINNVQLLIFDSETGFLNYYYNMGKASSSSIALYPGPKTVYALANGPSLTDVSTLDELEEVTYSLKEYNTSGGMIMMAKDDCDLTTDAELTLYLDRLASRVYVRTVTNSLPAAYPTLKVLSAMLGNVSSETSSYGTCVSTASLINPAGVLDNPVYDFTYKDINKNVANGVKESVATPLYCYQNMKIDENGTFVSLKVEIAGEPYYYTIFLDPYDLTKNSTSDINLNIIGLGSKDPSETVEKRCLEYEVEVLEWQFASSYTESI